MSKKPESIEGVSIPIQIEGAEKVPIAYANYIFITHTGNEFFVTFAQIHPPYLISPKKEDIERIQSIPATVVSRIALTPSKTKELIDVLQDNYNKYVKQEEIS